MAIGKRTSTGHELSDSHWLDAHFQCARIEYEAALRKIGVGAGRTALDAGCGNGGFLHTLCDLVGPNGHVVALDLAPENVALVEARIREGALPPNTTARVGTVLALPFEEATFDFVWCANVAQYLTEPEFLRAISEFARVSRPGATIAVKEYDCSLMGFQPINDDYVGRLWAARRANASDGALGPWCGSMLGSRLERAGLKDISRTGWLVERWAPVPPATRAFFESFLPRWAELSRQCNVPPGDVDYWRDLAADPSKLLDDPDFSFREFFVVTTGRVPR